MPLLAREIDVGPFDDDLFPLDAKWVSEPAEFPGQLPEGPEDLD